MWKYSTYYMKRIIDRNWIAVLVYWHELICWSMNSLVSESVVAVYSLLPLVYVWSSLLAFVWRDKLTRQPGYLLLSVAVYSDIHIWHLYLGVISLWVTQWKMGWRAGSWRLKLETYFFLTGKLKGKRRGGMRMEKKKVKRRVFKWLCSLIQKEEGRQENWLEAPQEVEEKFSYQCQPLENEILLDFEHFSFKLNMLSNWN